MAEYGQFKYGKIEKYGKYRLSSGGQQGVGEQSKFRIRGYGYDGKKTDYVVINREKVSIPYYHPPVRIRAKDGEWVRTSHETIKGSTPSVRIRSIDSEGNPSDWVIGSQGNLR